MLRKIWLAICGTLLCGGVVVAQQPNPFGNPGAYGYPGYGSPLPMGPMGPANAPPMGPGGMIPYGNPGPMGPGGMPPYLNPGWRGIGANSYPTGIPQPGPIPPDPRRPVGLPSYDGGGARQGAAEPYMVGPEKNPAVAQPPAKTLPAAPANTPAPMMAEPYLSPASCCEPTPPAEPYTLYEGARYLADVKQDNVVVFGQASFIHWWTRRDQTPPLLTTGDPATPNGNPGTLGNPDTVGLLGGRSIAPNEFGGAQVNIGIWLDPERLHSIEVGGFFLGRNSRSYAFASDANGSPLIAQPVFSTFPGNTSNTENAFTIALPGFLSGGASVTDVMSMSGAEVNFGRNLIRYNGWTLDGLVGVRYLYLNETLTTSQNSTILPAANNALDFLGNPIPAGATLLLNDSFNLTNRFYGGQIGARFDWVSSYKLDFGGTIKIAFGDTAHTAIIDGNTTLINGGTTATAPGGAYALPSDIGHYTVNDFTVITDLTLTVGYQIHPNVRLTAGYNLIYWPRVERPGEQIDRTQDRGQSPTDPLYAPGTIGTNPRFLNVRSDFWAQGINVGFELKY